VLLAPRRLEVALAVAVLVLGLGEVWVPFGSRQGHGSATAASVGVTLTAVALLWCRRVPLAGLVAFPVIWSVVALVAPTYVLFYGGMVPLELLVFMTARFGRGRAPAYGAGVAMACLLALDLFVSVMQEPGEIVFHWTVTLLVWSAGFGLRTWERRAQESLHRAVRAEVSAAEQSWRAVLDERTRIARELHDIVGHSVSSMVVQAGAAAEAMPDDEQFVRAALEHIRTTGHEALDEMRRLVTMLRAAEDVPLSPQPRLDALPDLVSRAGSNGLTTTLRVDGDVRPLPAGLDLAVFRIVQEALTNVRRHAAARRCDVTLVFDHDELRVDVVDDGTGASAAPGGGHGLVGMRERVGLYGGALDAGPLPGRGFGVRARLPLP
jgi:signal transduction histidine kinase